MVQRGRSQQLKPLPPVSVVFHQWVRGEGVGGLHTARGSQCSPSLPLLPLQLLDSYVMSSREAALNSAASRLLLSMAPGLDTVVVFQEKVRRGGAVA